MRPAVQIWGEAERFVRYARAIEQAGGEAYFSRGWLEFCDALVLPGGGDLEPWRYGQKNAACRDLEPERDGEELALLERAAGWKRPVLGICRGMQTINVFFGGTLVQDLPGHSAAEGADRFHRVTSVPCKARLWSGYRVVNSAHHQAVDALGAELEAGQWAPDGTVEALFHRHLPVWGVQWHPERMPGRVGEALFCAFLARCGAKEA